jgi:hypothetical protein
MNEEQMKELLFSLAWCPFSRYHNENVHEILKKAFPQGDFESSIQEFKEIYLSPPQSGSPK